MVRLVVSAAVVGHVWLFEKIFSWLQDEAATQKVSVIFRSGLDVGYAEPTDTLLPACVPDLILKAYRLIHPPPRGRLIERQFLLLPRSCRGRCCASQNPSAPILTDSRSGRRDQGTVDGIKCAKSAQGTWR